MALPPLVSLGTDAAFALPRYGQAGKATPVAGAFEPVAVAAPLVHDQGCEVAAGVVVAVVLAAEVEAGVPGSVVGAVGAGVRGTVSVDTWGASVSGAAVTVAGGAAVTVDGPTKG